MLTMILAISHGVPSPGNTTAPPDAVWIATGRSERRPAAGTSKNARGANTYFCAGLVPGFSPASTP
jgi:hypothetical protein